MKIYSRIAALLAAFALMAFTGAFAFGCAADDSGAAAGGSNAAESGSPATSEAVQSAQAEGEVQEGAEEGVPGKGDFDAAQALIGQQLTREEIEAAVGGQAKFEMSGAGCERGVYQGIFYYDGFSIYSRTYDKGQTFSVVSVSE